MAHGALRACAGRGSRRLQRGPQRCCAWLCWAWRAVLHLRDGSGSGGAVWQPQEALSRGRSLCCGSRLARRGSYWRRPARWPALGLFSRAWSGCSSWPDIAVAGTARKVDDMRIVSDKYTAIGGKIGTMVGLMNKSGMCFRNLVTPANPKTSPNRACVVRCRHWPRRGGSVLTAGERAGLGSVRGYAGVHEQAGDAVHHLGLCGLLRCECCSHRGGAVSDRHAASGWWVRDVHDPDCDVHDLGRQVQRRLHEHGRLGRRSRRCDDGPCVPDRFQSWHRVLRGPVPVHRQGDGGGNAPTSPEALAMGYDVVADTQYAAAIRVVRADGRYSQEQYFRAISS